jgi:nucleoside-diphosphate-sugar epimerase
MSSSDPGTAFDKAVVSDPPFEAVIHAASPYHFQAKSREEVEDLLTTAENGTTGVLQAIKAHAPTVKRVVVTSSFASIFDPKKAPDYQYSEKDWSPVTKEEAFGSPMAAYRRSKVAAEKSAWDFVEKEHPNFTLATVSRVVSSSNWTAQDCC